MPTVNDYLSALDAPQKAELERVRRIVKATVPDAEELISYGLPAFKYQGEPLLYYGAFKHHLSVFPTSGPTEALKDKLTDYKVTKGTIQFTLQKPLPEALLIEILQTRLAQIRG